MPLGERATNPATPYFVYEFGYGDRIFYVGISHSRIRMNQRWTYVKNLLRLKAAGQLKPNKTRDLERKSNQVIAALIEAGRPEYETQFAWEGFGKRPAEEAEKQRIALRLSQGNVLANKQHNPKQATVDEILKFLSP